MNRPHKIGELARLAAVPTSTIRHYERIGLLEPTGRTPRNYRYYGAEAVQRLRFIRAAQATGFSLDDIAVLLDLSERPSPPPAQVQRLIERRLAEVERRMSDLRHVRQVLRASLQACRRGESEGRCCVIDNLKSHS